MKELTLNEMEYISGGFNLFGAASGFASFVANSGVGFTSFVLTSGSAFASFVGDSAMAFGSFLTGQSNWETFVTAGKEIGEALLTLPATAGTPSWITLPATGTAS